MSIIDIVLLLVIIIPFNVEARRNELHEKRNMSDNFGNAFYGDCVNVAKEVTCYPPQ